MLASYTSRSILTLNEARAALGRPPLPDPQADRAMALTGAGYVPLGETAAAAAAKGFGKTAAWDEAAHPRWPAGAADAQGGRFAPGSVGLSEAAPPLEAPTTSADRKQVAEVIQICVRGYNRMRVSNGVTHFYAEYHCPDGREIEMFSIGVPLKGFIRQPP